MTTTEIQAFLLAVECGSISSAAEQLFVTQPALSRRLRNLEQELGYPLLLREKGVRGVRLTEQGNAFLSVARKWLALQREALSITDINRKPVLCLAAISSVSLNILPPILEEITKVSVPYNLDFRLIHSGEASSLVGNGFADLALIDYLRARDTLEHTNVLSLPVYSTPFLLVGEIARGKQELHPSRLDPANEIRLPWNTQFDLWHDHWFDSAVTCRIQADTVSVLHAILHGPLYAIIPLTELETLRQLRPDLPACRLTDGPPDEVVHCLTTVEQMKKPHVQHFMGLLHTQLQQYEGIHCMMTD